MPFVPENDVIAYIVVEDLGPLGRSFRETDLSEATRDTIIRNFISGQYENALRVVAFNTAEGWSRDMSEDVAGEIIDRAYDADETLTEGTKRFIYRYIDIERRPPAPSAARQGRSTGKRSA